MMQIRKVKISLGSYLASFILFTCCAAALNAQNLNGKWTLLQRDSSGYVRYEQCCGSAESYFILKDKEIEFSWWMDGVERSNIIKRMCSKDRCTIMTDSGYWVEDGPNNKLTDGRKWEIEIVD